MDVPGDLKFDIYAMTNPKNRADVEVLFQEALSELVNINKILADIQASGPEEK